MAKMYPDNLDSKVASNAEVLVYQCLKEQLNNTWTVFFGQPWFSHTNVHSPYREGECDFIIMNENYGVMIVEVKGGIAIEYDQTYQSWSSLDKGHENHEIKDPYKQAMTNVGALLNTLRTINQFRHLNTKYKSVNICFCVIFPEIDKVKGFEIFENHQHVTLLKNDLNEIEKKIIEVFKFHQNEANFNTKTTKDVIQLFIKAKESKVEYKATLKSIIDTNDQYMFEVTKQQEDVLKATKYMDKLVIQGVAGSGKTLLASKLANDFSSENKKTLFLCYNILLGSVLSKQNIENDSLTVSIYHDFIETVYNLNDKKYDFNKISDEDVFYEVLGQEKLKYDVLIIDEAQDFSDTKIEILRQFLNENGKCFLFMDENQRIIDYSSVVLEGFQRMILESNLRNSKPIFDVVKKYYLLEYPIVSGGPDVGSVEVLETYDEDNKLNLFSILRSKINVLVNEEKVKYSDITIITMKSMKKSKLKEFNLKTVSTSKFEETFNTDLLRIETVRRFKGVESNIVIVTELEGLLDYPEDVQKKLLYTAYSRAKHNLIIIPSTQTLSFVEDIIEK